MAYSTVLTSTINKAAGWEALLAAELVVSPPTLSEHERQTLLAIANIHSPPSPATEIASAADTITAAENGKTFYLNLAGGFTLTLPAAAAGLKFKFIVKTNPTTAYIILAATADTIVGWPSNIGGADSVADGNALGDQLNFAANVALAGDMAEFESDGTYWYVRAHAKAINAITITG